MLEAAQVAVGAVEGGGVVAGDIASLGERGQGLECRCGPERLVGAAVDELEQLHAELDVTQTAGAQLELAGSLVGRHVLLDAAPHRLDVLDEVLAARRLPDEGGDLLLVAQPDLAITGGDPGLEQGLELPRLGPAFVVGLVALDRAHERAVLALGTQGGVHGPQGPLGGRLGAGLHRGARQGRADAERGLLVGPLSGLGDEDDVDVADVVELATARLAHPDDGEPALLVPLAVLLPGDEQRRLERGLGELGQRLADGGHLGDRVW